MIFFTNKLIFILFIAFCLPCFAIAESNVEYQEAQASAWEETQGGNVRILISDLKKQPDDNKKISNQSSRVYHGAIEVQLQDGWKTYWRNPGSSGMAPSFEFLQKVEYQIFYPAPTLIQNEDDWAFGYYGRILIPFEVIIPSNENELSGSLTIGICKTICMPVDVNFSFNLNKKETTLENGAFNSLIAKAWASKPMPANDAFEVVDVKEKDAFLFVTVRHPTDEKTPELFLDGGTTEFGIAKTQAKKADETIYQVPILYRSSRWDGTFFYTAKGAVTSVSGEATLK